MQDDEAFCYVDEAKMQDNEAKMQGKEVFYLLNEAKMQDDEAKMQEDEAKMQDNDIKSIKFYKKTSRVYFFNAIFILLNQHDMNPSKNTIDTGTMINRYLLMHRISKTSLGRDINRAGISVLRYTENMSNQTDVLIDICYALKHNFFQEIADRLPADFTVGKVPVEDKQLPAWEKEMAQLKEQIKILEAEKAILLQAFRRD